MSSLRGLYEPAFHLQRLGQPDSAASLALGERLLLLEWQALSGEATAVQTQAVAQEMLDLVRRNLRSGVVTLSMRALGTTTQVWAMRRGELLTWEVPIGHRGFASRVAQARGALGSNDLSPNEELFELLVRPILPWLTEATQLVFVPDRSLGPFPLAAIRDRERGRWLVEDWTVVVVPSLLVAFQGKWSTPPASDSLLLVHSPAGAQASMETALLRAEAEAREIAAMYPSIQVLQGAWATPARVQAALGEARMFHVAAHAFNNASDPLSAAIALAPEPGIDAGEGLLATRDLLELDLTRLDLAVLAGCGTGAGEVSLPGGAWSLADGFHLAGTRVVLSAQWEIDDAEAREVLVETHRRMRLGATPEAALQAAQVKAAAGGLQSEATWGAFVVSRMDLGSFFEKESL